MQWNSVVDIKDGIRMTLI